MAQNYIIELKLDIKKNDEFLKKILERSSLYKIEFIDSDKYYFEEKKQILEINESIEILKKDLDETTSILAFYKNTDFSIWISREQPNLIFYFYFLPPNLFKKKYTVINEQRVDIYLYADLILDWFKPFQIHEMNIEYSNF